MLSAIAPALERQFIAPFRGLPASVYIQIVATLINTMGGIAKLFLPLYFLEHYQLSYSHIGLLMGFYGGGCLAGSYYGGVLSDRIDGRKLCSWMLVGSGVLTVMLALPLPIWAFFPLLLLTGLSDGAFRPANMRLVLEPCSHAKRPTAQGLQRVAFNLGTSLAGISGGLLAVYGYQWVFVAQGISSLLACCWMGWAYRHYHTNPPTPTHRDHPASESPLAANLAPGSPWQDGSFLRFIAGLMLIIAVFDQMYSTLGIFLREVYALGPQWIGYLFTLNGLMVVALQVWIARRVQGWGLRLSSHLGVLFTGCSFLLLNLGNSPFWAILCMFVLTIGELLLSPTWSTIVMQHSEGRQRGRYLGIYSAAWSGRTLYAPALGTWAYGSMGGQWLWIACAGLALLTVAIHHSALARMIRKTA